MAATPIPGIGARPAVAAGSVAVLAMAASLVFGAVYIWDCRRSGGEVNACWREGRQAAGLNSEGGLIAGAIGMASWALGFNTYNPRLRREEGEKEKQS